MKAGRELDALIAEKIMGCSALVKKEWSWKTSGGVIDSDSGTHYSCKCSKNHGWEEVKPYSTDISSAWEVVEHFNELGWDISVVGSGELKSSDSWHAEFDPRYIHGKSRDTIIESGHSAPEAICLAALKAVEHD